MYCRFTGLVKLHSILIRTTPDQHAPKVIKLFKNRDDLDFSLASELEPVATLNHPSGVGADPSSSPISVSSTTSPGQVDLDAEGIVEYALNRAKFSNLTSLCIYIPENQDEEEEEEVTKVLYVGLRGEFRELSKAPVIALYEAAANPKDHKNLVPNENFVGESM